jgi:uncharacterized peroxidase-related enzyme
MRLTILERGQPWRVRLFFTTLSWLSRVEMSDVPKALLYRPEFVGRAMLDFSAGAMRGPSYWSAGEREYVAVFTARLHQCPYCVTTHTELTRLASGGAIVAGDAGSVRPELRAVLPFLEQVTCSPERVSARDLVPVREAGVPDRAIVEALHVNLVWNVVNRLANAFGFTLREGQLAAGTRSLHRFGYRFPRFVTGGRMVPKDEAIAQLRQAVRSSPAAADLPGPLGSYARMVRDESYRVSDADITRLRAAGHREDEIFEVTVTTTVGAALRSFDAGHAAVSLTTTNNEGGRS